MLTLFLKKYISIIFLISTFMGVFHHHDNLKQHNDCQICIIQSNISDIDTPVDVFYLNSLNKYSQKSISKLFNLHINLVTTTFKARAPPKIS